MMAQFREELTGKGLHRADDGPNPARELENWTSDLHYLVLALFVLGEEYIFC
ncbi:hypothetical protein [Mesobacillus foraminis]|uniref:hypothetical protein n=1 Tax=Mesobacillus foraminis TaxID=279826 RepID=UPI001304B62D|nr:hypothetical protein [Mesobacillus foraminis]